MKTVAAPVAITTSATNPALAMFIQRACACGGHGRPSGECEECEAERRFGAQTKLSVSEPGDPHEEEADTLASEVMRVPATAGPAIYRRVTPLVQRQSEPEPVLEEEEEKEEAEEVQAKHLQRQEDVALDEEEEEGVAAARKPLGRSSGHREQAPGSDFRSQLKQERSSGDPLPEQTRSFMESRFGVDFGHVRVHRGGRAAALARDVHAQAFTLGSHVYFGSGYYEPDSTSGRQLLAHELVHTIQQTAASSAGAPKAPATDLVVQRQEEAFVPVNVPKGTEIHKKVLPLMGAAEGNADLFTEVKIPGANKDTVEESERGVADFYEVDDNNKTTIAVVTENGEPQFLPSDRKLQKGGKKFDHSKLGAPLGPKRGQSCDGKGAQVCRLDQAPTKIRLGDLKPAASAEAYLGEAQIRNYKQGIELTSRAVNSFISTQPADITQPPSSGWHPTPEPLKREIGIHPGLRYGKTNDHPLTDLRMWDGNRRGKEAIVGLKGRLTVYKDKVDGIWVYEWIPTEYPPALKKTTSPKLKKALGRIEELIKQLKSPTEGKGGKKGLTGPRASRTHTAGEAVVQRRITFEPKRWNESYNKWRDTEAKTFLGSKEVGLLPAGKGTTPESEEAKTARVAAGLIAVQNRTKLPMPLPQPIRQRAKDYKLIRRWAKWGSVFGRLRAAFGGLFVKISSLFEKAKQKFADLRRNRPEKKSSGDSITKAIVGSALKVAYAFFKVMVSRVTIQLKKSLEKAATVLIESFFSEESLEKVEQAKQDFEELVAKVEAEIKASVDDRVKALVGPYEERFKEIEEVGTWVRNIGKLVSAVKWGLRIIQCVTPPGLGCLKLILQAIVEELAARVTASCWFQLNFIKPLLSKFDIFTTLPQKISGFILDQIKAIASALPFSKETLDKAFPTPAINTNVSARDLECDPNSVTPAQREMNKLLDKYGAKRIREMIKLLEEGGLTDDREMTVADVQLLRDLIEKIDNGEITEGELTDAIANLKQGKPSGVKGIDDFLDKLGIGPGKAGPSGAEGTGAGGVQVVPFDKAKYAGEVRTLDSSQFRVFVLNASPSHKKGTKPNVDLGLFIDGDHVMTVEGVPAEVIRIDESSTAPNVSEKVVVYKLKSRVAFRHGVKGIEPSVVVAGKPTSTYRGFPMLNFVIEGEPAGTEAQ